MQWALYTALKYQCDFFTKIFFPLVAQIKQPNFYLSSQYLNSAFGKLRAYKEFEQQNIKSHETLKRKIYDGLRKADTAHDVPSYVSFVVMAKHGSTETKSDKHLDMHMCVYTVRSVDGRKDCIYFDPVAEAYKHHIPELIRDLPSPLMETATRSYGTASQRNDCVYQSMKYIIGLHTGELNFSPDVSQQNFRYVR